jgi:two-component system LytT family response regulator
VTGAADAGGPVRVLVAEDEPLARARLRELLARVTWVDEVLEASDGPAAVRMLDDHCPDLVLLDVRMPGASGIEVLELAEHEPEVIFTTAFDRYAVTAFELQAIDYLLKPFGPVRFAAAMERAREALRRRARPSDGAGSAGDEEEAPPGDSNHAASLAPAAGRRARAAMSAVSLTRLFVRDRGRITPVAVDRIERLEARGDYVCLHADGARHLVHTRLRDLLGRLDPDVFVRVHRSHAVNLDHVVTMIPWDGSRLQLVLRSGERLLASRARSRELRGRAI